MKAKLFYLLIVLVVFGGVTWIFWNKKTREENVSLPPSLPSSVPIVKPSDGFGKMVKLTPTEVDFLSQVSQIRPKFFVVSGTIKEIEEKFITLKGHDEKLGTYPLSGTIRVTVPKDAAPRHLFDLRPGNKVNVYIEREKDNFYRVILIRVDLP